MKKQPTQEQANSALECILGQKTVGFYPVIAKALGSAPAAIMVSQAFFWQYKAKFGSPIVIDGEQYFSKTVAEWYEETSVSESAQRLARSILTKHGIMVEKLAGLPASMHFRVDINALVAVINGYLSTGITVAAKHGNKERELTRTGSGKFRRQEATKDGDILNVETSESFESEGERTPPAPNPSNLQSQKKENGLVAPAENPETVKAEKKEKDFIPRGAAPADCDGSYGVGKIEFYPAAAEDEDAFAQWLPSLHTAMENNAPGSMPKPPYPLNLGFCGNCMGIGYRNGRNGRETCEDCEGSGHGDQMIADPQFEVTAIASPTDLPGVTLVEAAPIHHRKNGRIEIPDEAAAEILPWVKGDGAQTVKSWYDRAFRQHSPKDVEDMVMRFSTVFLSSEKAAFRDMMETNPLSFFKRRFAGFVADQKQYDRNNAPKEGGATRQNGQPHSALPRSLQNQVGK